MMRICVRLLRYLLWQTLPVTAAAVPVAAFYVLLMRTVLSDRAAGPPIFVLVHALIVTRLLGRPGARDFAFLYTRGYSRDCLWAHTMLASIAAVLTVWLPAALLIWTGARNWVQDRLFQNPEFPIMAVREMLVPFKWLAGYAVLLPIFHYAWIRRAQPTRGRSGGTLAAVALVVGMVCTAHFARYPDWRRWLTFMAYGIAVVAMLVASMRLHRRVEVEA